MKSTAEMILGATELPTGVFHLDQKRNRSCTLASAGPEGPKQLEIDYSWLPLCADTYEISPDIKDYVFTQVPILTGGYPNRNLQAFGFEELTRWDINQGKPVYKTFVGKPTYTNHKNNTIPHLAKGVHFDSSIEFVPQYGLYKIHVLLGFCAQKDRGLYEAIRDNVEITGYSMGAMVEAFLDSGTGKMIGLKDPDYNRSRGKVQNNRLRYLSCVGATFFETSCLGSFGRGDPGEPPADSSCLPENSKVFV